MAIRPELAWANVDHAATPWLSEYAVVPASASPPLAMTPPHEEAVGSYGPALVAWAAETQGVRVRWWQGLAICRILEHRDDGSLCWEEVVLSCSRRSGKSVIVRLLALWRMHFAPALFGETQLIVHSATTLRVAKEPMRYASTWAAQQDHLSVYTNNNNYAIEDRVDGHRWVVLPVDKTAGLDTCMGVLDEAWSCKPEIVDDDLEPSLLERVSPQLLLVSTAHRRATSLMRGRISGALAGEGGDRVLLLFWGAPPDAEPGDPATWRAASPHWTPERERYLRRKYRKAQRGEQDEEFDDPDPMQGFIAQYLNVWRLNERAPIPGDAVVAPEAWAELVAEVPDRVPDAVAVEAWFADGVSVARAWREGVVSVTDHLDLADAAAAVRATGFARPVIVGASLVSDPALHGIRARPGQGRSAAAATELGRLAADGVGHDGGEHLTEQLVAVRILRGPDGGRLTSKGRVDAVKAAAWALGAARRPGPGRQRVLVPSSVRGD
jgi:hypothetical protein